MNDQIYKLALEAGFSTWVLNPSKETMSDTPELLKKFAELLIQKCADVAKYHTPDTEECEYTWLIHDKIKEHFGVD